MKQNTQTILTLLKDENLLLDLSNLLASNADVKYNDTNYKEAYESFIGYRNLLIDEIEKGRFDSLTFTSRNNILSQFQQISQQRSNPSQIIILAATLQEQINLSGILFNRIGKTDYTAEIKELGKIKSSINGFIKTFEQTQENLKFIDVKKAEVEKLIETINERKNEVEESKKATDTSLTEILSTYDLAIENLELIKESQKTIEETKLGITTFSQNIDEYKKNIEVIEKKAAEVVAKDDTISKIIEEAREALKLSSAVGISAAFSAQYDEANKSVKYRWWIIGAVFSLVLAALFTIWAIGGWGTKNPDSLSSIMARVVGVGVTISAAAFCAKQYVRQKNIAEDYAYKAVLSKSIVAFTEELSMSTDNNNDDHVSHYLIKVLDEIHKDPLRSRKEPNTSSFSKFDMEKMNSLVELINKVKG